MAYQFIRGNTTDNDGLTRASGALSIDFEGETVRVHDGSTPGGAFSLGISTGGTSTDLSVNYAPGTFTITSSSGNNAQVNSATSVNAGAMSSADKSKLDTIEEGAQANVGDPFDATETYPNLRAQSTTRDDVGLGTTAFSDEVVAIIEADAWTVDEGVI